MMAIAAITCNPALCTGCQVCEFACALAKAKSFDLEIARIRTARPEPDQAVSIACRLCPSPPCVASCPRDALSQDPAKGIILLNKARCSGCGWCIEACEFGAIAMDPSTKSVVICDLCPDLPKPRCLELCPQQALSLSSPAQTAGRNRDRAARRELASP
ncbi:MAG: 4Fe-4S dicluster domain-containing protein [Chloroflexi bacterium]|nr:4Fe-4S dicluster domain-containing protein [Chloroflexota bacterium]